jgi:glycine cleavage system transcriptional repressor
MRTTLSNGVRFQENFMAHQLVVTAIGPDRKGLVGELTGHIHRAGANLADSRMVNLEGQFALLMLLEGDAAVIERARQEIREAAPSLGLSITYAEQPRPSAIEAKPSAHFRLKTYSMDQLGIVHRVTKFLQEQGINIEELETKLDSAPFAGTDMFTMEILMSAPPTISAKALKEGLTALSDALSCDIDLDPA